MTVPFLISHTPYRYSGQVCQSINDMISVDLQQTVETSTIEYDIGSSQNINLPLTIKNITDNADLNVSLINSPTSFLINGEAVATKTAILRPAQSVVFNITLNKNILNQVGKTLQATIQLVVNNLTNGQVATCNPSISKLNIQNLPNRLL